MFMRWNRARKWTAPPPPAPFLSLPRRYDSEADKERLVPMLRDVSRQQYLAKREEQKLDELRDELQDAKYLFGDVELSAKERADLK